MLLYVMLVCVTGEPQAAEPSQAENGHAQPQALPPAAKPDPLVSLKELVNLLTALSIFQIERAFYDSLNCTFEVGRSWLCRQSGEEQRKHKGAWHPADHLLEPQDVSLCVFHRLCRTADSQ